MRCEHKASSNYDYQCVLQRGHKGLHVYEINKKRVNIRGCCPDGQIERYESED
jgi:hypothetical protein